MPGNPQFLVIQDSFHIREVHRIPDFEILPQKTFNISLAFFIIWIKVLKKIVTLPIKAKVVVVGIDYQIKFSKNINKCCFKGITLFARY